MFKNSNRNAIVYKTIKVRVGPIFPFSLLLEGVAQQIQIPHCLTCDPTVKSHQLTFKS